MSNSAYAITNIDAQSTTKCIMNDCYTIFNFKEHLTPLQLTTVKSIDTKTLIPTSSKMGSLKDFKVSWINDTTIKISGKITENVYWNLPISSYVSIDPWWNTTNYNITNWTSTTATKTGTENNVNYWHGVQFKTLKSGLKLIEVEKFNGDNYTYVGLQNSTHHWLQNKTYSGDIATFDYDLAFNTTYYIVNYDPVSNTVKGVVDPASFSYVSDALNISNSVYTQLPYTSYNTYTDKVFSIYRIKTQTNTTYNTSIYYEHNLFINNAQANITTTCSGVVTTNYTATTNLTGLPISIMYNGTVANTSTNTVSWYGSLIKGYWNITSNASNSSTSSNITLFHNITFGVASANLTFNTTGNNNTTCLNQPVLINCSSIDLEDSVILYNSTSNLTTPYTFTPTIANNYTFICNWTSGDCYSSGSTNRTLQAIDCSSVTTGNYTELISYSCTGNNSVKNVTYSSNGINYTTNLTYTSCQYGCSNQECKPPYWYSDIIGFGVFLAFIVGLVLLLRWYK